MTVLDFEGHAPEDFHGKKEKSKKGDSEESH